MAPRRPRDIGTVTETAVCRFVRTAGFPHCERRALRGILDAGDLTGTPLVAWSIKGGQMAKAASDALIQIWLDELMGKQVPNASADVGVLVVQRRGIGEANAGRWWGIMPGWQYERLAAAEPYGGLPPWKFGDRGPIRQTLAQVCALLTYAGYGTAPTPTELITEGAAS